MTIHTPTVSDHTDAYDFAMMDSAPNDFIELQDSMVIKLVESWPTIIIGNSTILHFHKSADERVLAQTEYFEEKNTLAFENPAIATFVENLEYALFNREQVTLGGGIFDPHEISNVVACIRTPVDLANISDSKTFHANLKRAIFDHEEITIGGGVFNQKELKEVEPFFKQRISQVQMCLDMLALQMTPEAAPKSRPSPWNEV